MKLDPKKVLTEINALELALKKALKEKIDFEKTHEEVRTLCKALFKLKNEYRSVDIDYPDPITAINIVAAETGKKMRTIEIPYGKTVKWDLAREELRILKKTKSIFSLRDKLESKKENVIKERINKLEDKIKSIESFIKSIS